MKVNGEMRGRAMGHKFKITILAVMLAAMSRNAFAIPVSQPGGGTTINSSSDIEVDSLEAANYITAGALAAPNVGPFEANSASGAGVTATNGANFIRIFAGSSNPTFSWLSGQRLRIGGATLNGGSFTEFWSMDGTNGYFAFNDTSPDAPIDITFGGDGIAVALFGGATNLIRVVPKSGDVTLEATNAAQSAFAPFTVNGSTFSFQTGGTTAIGIDASQTVDIRVLLSLPQAADIDEGITPSRINQVVANSGVPGEVCISTATNSGAWVLISNIATPCSN